jgi:deazaflavin-dependent oxidoreductase (nitroreductase family)
MTPQTHSPRLGRRMAHFNRRVTNRLTRPVARRLPGFCVVLHRGRKSGREYATPVNAFAAPGGWVIPLTYGSDAEWVKNVVAAGGCSLITRGRRLRLTTPEIVRDDRQHPVPWPVRPFLRFMRVTEFLQLAELPPDERP